MDNFSELEIQQTADMMSKMAVRRKEIEKENTTDVIDDRMDKVQHMVTELESMPLGTVLDVEFDDSINPGKKIISRIAAEQLKSELSSFLDMAVRKHNMSKYMIPNSWNQVEG
jgi:hypothetical protein